MGPSQFLRINKRGNLVTAFLESIKLGIFVSGNWEELLFSGKLAHSPKTRRKKISEENVEKPEKQTLTKLQILNANYKNSIVNFVNVTGDNKESQTIATFFDAKI